MYIIGTNTSNGVRLIAVHINQSLKAILLAAVKQPVNRTFLINFAMVRIEATQKIIPNHILRLTFAAQRISNEFQIFVQCIFTVNRFYELHKQTNNIILEVFIVANWYNVIFIHSKRSIFTVVPFATCIGKSIYIQRVTTKHTTNCVRNERANISAKVSLADSDILILNFWYQLILQTINLNEDTVQFFLISFQLVKPFFTFSLPLIEGFGNSRNFTKKWMMLEIP